MKKRLRHDLFLPLEDQDPIVHEIKHMIGTDLGAEVCPTTDELLTTIQILIEQAAHYEPKPTWAEICLSAAELAKAVYKANWDNTNISPRVAWIHALSRTQSVQHLVAANPPKPSEQKQRSFGRGRGMGISK